MELVFEIGCEELPAGSLRPAVEFMAAELKKGLEALSLTQERSTFETFATPRRLALIVTGIAERGPDLKKKLLGPPVKSAFGPDGKATKAGEGFAKKAGVLASALAIEGDRVVVEQEIKGQLAAEALPGLLTGLIGRIPFKKSMRWGSGSVAFARPVHWICAALDSRHLEVVFGEVKSGPDSRGHRFQTPAAFPLPRASGYLSALRERHVLADWAERRARVWEEVQRAAREASGEPLPDDELLETVTGLIEEPSAVAGRFEEEFLELPPEVLVSEMRGHQKYFAVRDPVSKKLLPAFVAVSNTRVKDPAVSRRGYERVLRARLSDGKFFFDEDRKSPLASRIEKLSRVTFLNGLGTQLERVERLRETALWLHGATGQGEPATLRRAAELSKADLTTGMVGEFPDLQGTMGRVYALREGVAPAVANALFEHYLPRGADERMPAPGAEGDTGALLGMADRLDQLVGIFGIGKEPSGTADPYGLRRAALGFLRLTLARKYRLELRDAIAQAQKLHGEQKKAGAQNKVTQDAALVDKVWGFLSGRLEALWKDRASPDSIQAALGTGSSDVVSLEQRLVALHTVREQSRAQFEATAATFKRIANILAQAQEKKLAPMGFSEGRIPAGSKAEAALARALGESRVKVQDALEEREDYLAAYAVLADLRPLVDGFFDGVMVMVEDTSLRDNRLALLRALHELFAPLADFSRLQIEKS